MNNPNPFLDLRPTTLPQSVPLCPKCRSKNVCSAAKNPTPDSYWRCATCGEVWNPVRAPKTAQQRWPR